MCAASSAGALVAPVGVGVGAVGGGGGVGWGGVKAKGER
jgi:hypothetical protein